MRSLGRAAVLVPASGAEQAGAAPISDRSGCWSPPWLRVSRTYAAITGRINVGPRNPCSFCGCLDLVLLSLLAGIVAWQLFRFGWSGGAGLSARDCRCGSCFGSAWSRWRRRSSSRRFRSCSSCSAWTAGSASGSARPSNEFLFIATAYLRENQEGVINGTGMIALYLRRPGSGRSATRRTSTRSDDRPGACLPARYRGHHRRQRRRPGAGRAGRPGAGRSRDWPEKYKFAREGGGTPA